MIRSITIICLLFLSVLSAQAQTKFQLNLGGLTNGRIIISRQTMDGGYMFSGYTNSTDMDYFLIKIDSASNLLWTKTYGTALTPEFLFEAIQTTDGGYMMAGYNIINGRSNMYFVKVDANGDTLFTRTFGGIWNESAASIIQTNDGGYLAAGAFSDNSTPTNVSMLIYKMDASGDSTWSKLYSAPGATSWELASGIKQTSDGGYIIAGDYNFGQFTRDAYLVKIDNSGTLLWNKTYHFPGTTTVASIEETPDDGFIVGGKYIPVGGLNDKLFLLRTNSVGDTLWTSAYGGQYLDDGGWVTQTSDGGFIQSGRTENFGANSIGDACLLKTTSSGAMSWSFRYGGNQSELFSSVDQTTDGGYITGGVTGSFGTGYFYIVKTDSLGNSNCSQFATPAVATHPPVSVGTTALGDLTPGSIVSNSSTIVGSLSSAVNTICYTTTGINETENNFSGISVFPNPTNDQINIILSGDQKTKLEYLLTNIQGQQIIKGTINSTDKLTTLNIDSFPSGIYILKVICEEFTKQMQIVKL